MASSCGRCTSTGIVWYTWAGTTGSITATTDAAWGYWVDAGTTSATTTIDYVWPAWTREAARRVATAYVAPERTPEQIAADEQRARELRAQDEWRRRQRAEASRKAKQLLLDHLNDDQRRQFEDQRAFTVISKDGERRYRIEDGTHGNVYLLNEEGLYLRRFCIQTREMVPSEDVMLAQKLFIEHDEAEFNRVANASDIRLAA